MADNLLANPQNMAAGALNGPAFVVGQWYFVNGDVLSGISDPQGLTTAFRFREQAITNGFGWEQPVPKPAQSITYRLSAYVRSNGRNVELGHNAIDLSSGSFTIIDTVTGAVLVAPSDFGAGTCHAGPVSVVPAGNGYFLMNFDATVDASEPFNLISIFLADGTNDSYVGDGVSGIDTWSPSLIAMPSLMPSRVIRI